MWRFSGQHFDRTAGYGQRRGGRSGRDGEFDAVRPLGVRPPPNAITTIEAVAHRCRLTHTLAPMAIIGPLHLGHHLAEIGRPCSFPVLTGDPVPAAW
jgi:hypothetical protein